LLVGAAAEVRRAPATWRDLRAVPSFLVAVAVVFGLQLVDRSFGPVLPLYLGEVGIAADRIPFLTGVIFTLVATAAAFGNQFTGRVIATSAVGAVVAVCAGIAAVGALVFASGSSVPVMLIAAPVFGVAMGVATTAVYTDVAHRVDAGSRRKVAPDCDRRDLAALPRPTGTCPGRPGPAEVGVPALSHGSESCGCDGRGGGLPPPSLTS